jgi:hypothetical protein
MYVRWKRAKRGQKCAGYKYDWGDRLSAVLVQSERVDGKPRQKYIAHLGSIGEQCTQKGYHPVEFWRKVQDKLNGLGLPVDEKNRIIERVAETVPIPTQEYIDQQWDEFRQITVRLSKLP